jgi:GDP-L-fucose synthase
MIYFGSGAEFNREYWKPKMKEDYFDKHVPIDQYGFSKYIMTKYSQTHASIINLRLFGVFGKYDDWRTRFISNACCHAVQNIPISINQNVAFDHLYVDDLVKIVQWFIENNPRHTIYNLCSGVVYDFRTLAEKIMSVSGKNVGVTVKKEGMGKEYSGDNSLLLKEMNGFPFTPIDSALKALYGWHEKNRHILNDIL